MREGRYIGRPLKDWWYPQRMFEDVKEFVFLRDSFLSGLPRHLEFMFSEHVLPLVTVVTALTFGLKTCFASLHSLDWASVLQSKHRRTNLIINLTGSPLALLPGSPGTHFQTLSAGMLTGVGTLTGGEKLPTRDTMLRDTPCCNFPLK